MADDEQEEETIELGDGQNVEGAPVARIAERLMWGIEKSTIEDREGDTLIRTPDGSKELEAILEDVETTYFDTRQRFEDAVHEVIGTGPVPTHGGGDGQFSETLSKEDEAGDEETADDGTEDETEESDNTDE